MRATGFRQRPRGGGGGAAALGFGGGPWCWFRMASYVNSVSADVHVIANLWISHAELDDFLLLTKIHLSHSTALLCAAKMFHDLNVPWGPNDRELQRTIAFLDECEL